MLGHDVGVWVEVREQRKKTKGTTKPLMAIPEITHIGTCGYYGYSCTMLA